MHMWGGGCMCGVMGACVEWVGACMELWPHVWDSGCICGIVGACVG